MPRKLTPVDQAFEAWLAYFRTDKGEPRWYARAYSRIATVIEDSAPSCDNEYLRYHRSAGLAFTAGFLAGQRAAARAKQGKRKR